MIDINEGRTNNYLIHGLGVMVPTIVCFALAGVYGILFIIPAFILFAFALMLFSATNGLELDAKKDRYRRYGKMINFKFGEWKPLSEPKSAVLQMHAANAYKGMAPMVGRVATLDTKTLTYDIEITDAFGQQHIVYDFLDYKKAKVALKSIHENYEIPVQNKIAEKLAENRQKRR